MKDFLLNENFSMLNTDNLIPLESTGVFAMSRTIELTFNVQNKSFKVGYLNHQVDRSVRNSVVHCYYLSIDTRLSQFIEFLCAISPEQARNSKINNINQIVLKVTFARKGQVFYNLIIKGDLTGVMTFRPSEFKDYQAETEPDITSLEPLINSIINEEEEEPTKLSFYIAGLVSKLTGFRVQYKDYEYFKARKYHVYDLVLNEPTLELVELLRLSYTSENKIVGEVEEVYLRINEKISTASLLLYGKDTDIQEYERIDFIPTLLKDLGDESRNLPEFPKTPRQEVKSSPIVVDVKQQIIDICKEIVDIRNHTTEKIDRLKELLDIWTPVEEKKEKPKKVKDTIHRVYKEEVETGGYVHVGSKNLKDEVVFRVPIWSESRRKDLQKSWNVYHPSFCCQTTWVYDDGTTKVGRMKEFTPSNKIQQFESSDRTGVVGYVEQAGGLVEVIYYDRFVS